MLIPFANNGRIMLIGINYPWIDYGWDFGGPPPVWVAGEHGTAWRERKQLQIEADFSHFACHGLFAVRWFIMADGLNFGMGEHAPRTIGGEWTFEPLPVGDPYYGQLRDDFEFVMGACARARIKLFPSLIDFSFCGQGTVMEGSPGIVKGGRHALVSDPQKRTDFLDRVLDPLLEISARHPDSIYAWELINEPEWAVRKFPALPKGDKNRTVSLKEMKAFIADGTSRINGKKLPDGRNAIKSSVGFAHWDTLNAWNSPELGITLRQFHYYAQENRSLPPHARSEDSPCVIGEFATARGSAWPDLERARRDQTLDNRLRCVEDKGYPACFMWSARAVDTATRWTAESHREVLAYLHTQRRGTLA